jgi:hypothetical protein
MGRRAFRATWDNHQQKKSWNGIAVFRWQIDGMASKRTKPPFGGDIADWRKRERYSRCSYRSEERIHLWVSIIVGIALLWRTRRVHSDINGSFISSLSRNRFSLAAFSLLLNEAFFFQPVSLLCCYCCASTLPIYYAKLSLSNKRWAKRHQAAVIHSVQQYIARRLNDRDSTSENTE